MKTLQELYDEIAASDELKNAFSEAAFAGKSVEFFRENGCETTREELAAFLKTRSGELSDEALDAVSGGTGEHTSTEPGTKQSDSDEIVSKGPISLEEAEPVRVVLDDAPIVKILANGR